MSSQRWLQVTKHSPRIVWFPSKLVSVAAISSKALSVTCAIILICTTVNLRTYGQNAGTDTIESRTKKALASEWVDVSSDGVTHVLRALQLLTSSSLAPEVKLLALDELKLGGPNPSPQRQGLYIEALGAPDKFGKSGVQGFDAIADTLATANTLGLKKPQDEDKLFAETETLIEAILNGMSSLPPFPTGTKRERLQPEEVPGPVMIVRINSSFSGGDKDVALYQLLEAYPKDVKVQDKQRYANDLEKFRAAFAMNADRLASQVAALIPAPKT